MRIDSSFVQGKMKDKMVGIAKDVEKIGRDDPRRIVHSTKVGVALTLNSLFYYYDPLYEGFGQYGIWALLTVMAVFEFTVGATLSKGLNRASATLLAAAMGVGAKYLGDLSGDKAEPVVLGILVYILAAILSFTRFFPGIKTKYDYGVVIFILTFSMVAVSSYRTDEIIQFAHQRLSTVAIGGVICLLISVLVCPAWAGEDLQNLIAANIENLGKSLEGFGSAYFRVFEGEGGGMEAFPQDYKSAFNSKATEDSLAVFAWWEFGHGKFTFGHPWEEYLKVGGLTRECASHLQALSSYFNTDDDEATFWDAGSFGYESLQTDENFYGINSGAFSFEENNNNGFWGSLNGGLEDVVSMYIGNNVNNPSANPHGQANNAGDNVNPSHNPHGPANVSDK
nr:aluminum-activated malate transporter 8-like [Ipomoea batatas]